MKENGKTRREQKDTRTPGPPRALEDRLLEEYGSDLDGDDITDEQKKAFLLALWQIMVAFVDLGFSIKPGDKLFPESDIGFDDVLNYICLDDPARETVALPEHQQQKERP